MNNPPAAAAGLKHTRPMVTSSLQECVDFVRLRLGQHWVMGAPLALGKPNHLINALYLAARADPAIRLDIFTALSLNPPKPAHGLKQRFLGPFVQRQFGDYPRLEYLQDLDLGRIPDNITISEFYFRSGTRLQDRHAQRHYVSSNYTHVARDMHSKGVNLLVQMVVVHPERPQHYSLGSNPDVTLDLLRRMPREKLLFIAQLNPDMPYMDGDAELPRGEFDLVLEQHPQPLFAVPRMPVSDEDFLIGLHTSQLIRDGGTLQVGIGSLGDAVCYSTRLRHQHNATYCQLLDAVEAHHRASPGLCQQWGGHQPFEQGLYAASEMFMDGLIHLYQAGVLKRRVYDHPGLQTLLNRGQLKETLAADCLDILWQEGLLPARLDDATLAWLLRFGILQPGVGCDESMITLAGCGSVENDLAQAEVRAFLQKHAQGRKLTGGVILHAAFFLGSRWMYDTLNAMSRQERSLFQMTGVSRVNQLYGAEVMDRAQRQEGRFINTTMKMTLLGAAASDQLNDGQVVSGVGGQYNFVAMAHALERGRSILMLRSYRDSGKQASSNIVWEYPHTTIPRHLRDIVVTEYGAADLRSADDEAVIQKMICIADSRWQQPLRAAAVKAGKLDPAWSIPAEFGRNTPQWVHDRLRCWRTAGIIRDYPFGSDFTVEEQTIVRALTFLATKGSSRAGRVRLVLAAMGARGRCAAHEQPGLARMALEKPTSLRERMDRRLLCLAFKSTTQDAVVNEPQDPSVHKI